MSEGLAALERRTFLSLAVRNYRLYLLGQGISLCGTWMQIVAQSWLILQLTGSGTALGLVNGLQSLPMLLCSPWFGVLIDRLPKRRILYLTQGLSAVLALLMGWLVAGGLIQIWMVYVLALALGLVNALDYPTRQAFMSELVGPEYLANAIPLYAGEANLARVFGPALGGWAIALFGLATCFYLNGLSFLAVLAVLLLLRSSELHPAVPAKPHAGQLVQGLRYAWVNPSIRVVLVMTAIIATLGMEFQIVLPLLVHQVFHGSVTTYAALTAWIGLGAILGSLNAAAQAKASPGLMLGAAMLFGIFLLLAAIMPSIGLIRVAMVFIGYFSTMFISLGNVIVQLGSSVKMRGRVMALWAVAFAGSTVIGGPVIGWIGELDGARWGLAVGGVAVIAAAIYGTERFPKRI